MAALTDHRDSVYYLVSCDSARRVYNGVVGKKDLLPPRQRRYILWRRLGLLLLLILLAEVFFFLCKRLFFFIGAPFFSFNLSWIDVPKNYGFDMWYYSLLLTLSFSLYIYLYAPTTVHVRTTAIGHITHLPTHRRT
jgi:hypothetical protein